MSNNFGHNRIFFPLFKHLLNRKKKRNVFSSDSRSIEIKMYEYRKNE